MVSNCRRRTHDSAQLIHCTVKSSGGNQCPSVSVSVIWLTANASRRRHDIDPSAARRNSCSHARSFITACPPPFRHKTKVCVQPATAAVNVALPALLQQSLAAAPLLLGARRCRSIGLSPGAAAYFILLFCVKAFLIMPTS